MTALREIENQLENCKGRNLQLAKCDEALLEV